MAAVRRVSPIAPQGIGVRYRRRVRVDAAPKRFAEHDRERQHEKDEQKAQRDGYEQKSHRERFRHAGARARRHLYAPFVAPVRRPSHPCSALMASSKANDATSITAATAVAAEY